MVRLRLTSRGKRSDDLMADIDAATAVLRKALGGDLMDGSSSHRALRWEAVDG